MAFGWARATAVVVLVGWGAPGLAAEVPTPESVLGFRAGEDRKLADWTQIVDYFHKLDAASDRVIVEEVGRTTRDRPFLVATITSEANMGHLEEIRGANLRLADPRGLSPEEAQKLIATGKTIVAHNHGIHSNEVAASQTSMRLAYELATAKEPALLDVLDKTVIVMIPSHNPDGTQLVADWYRQSLGKPWEGAGLPFLYHHYVGHDNNRDWYMFTQVESRLTVKHLYDRWHPQIVHDLHQMGSRTARIFMPPFVDPWEPNVDPALIAASNAIGTHMAARLTAQGLSGVVVNAMYDGWTPARAYPHTHGGVRILTECASAKFASPIEVKREDLEADIGYDAKVASWNFPNPWAGGTWRLGDIVEYQMAASYALLEHAARHRDFWLDNFYRVNLRAATRARPHAFVIPTEQADPLATARLLEVLKTGGIEIHRARVGFEAAGRRIAAGSVVVRLAQPAGGFAKTLLERQRYPDVRQYPGGPPQRPYDVTAHTLPLLMGVDVVAVDEPFHVTLEKLDKTMVAPGAIVGAGRFYALGHTTGDLVALGRLLKAGVQAYWALHDASERGETVKAGALLVPASALRKLQPLVRELGISARAVQRRPRSLALRAPRVALYQSWVPSMDEGWTRYVFEKELDLPYTTIDDADVRSGGLGGRYDVIVIPDQAPRSIVNGWAPGAMPESYAGGLGEEGVAKLKTFVEGGGTLVMFNDATKLALSHLGVAAKNVLEPPKAEAGAPAPAAASSDFYCPGALLGVSVDPASPWGHGLAPSSVVWFEDSPAFEAGPGDLTVASYTDDDPLRSGWLLGAAKLKGKAAMLVSSVGKGKIVLFGFRPQYRAQSWATYVPMINALYLAAATPEP